MGHMNEVEKQGFIQKCMTVTHGARTVIGVRARSGKHSQHLQELRDNISGTDVIREAFIKAVRA